MKSNTLSELISKIDEIHKLHLSSRGIIQYISEKYIGHSQINWVSKTKSSRFNICYSFEAPIDQQVRSEINRISDYMNQNFIVRLHSLLEYEGIKKEKTSIDKSLNGYEAIELIHYLRKEFAHKDGKYSETNKSSVILRKRLFEKFGIGENESLPDQFPLDKNRIINPLVIQTKTYVEEYWAKYL